MTIQLAHAMAGFGEFLEEITGWSCRLGEPSMACNAVVGSHRLRGRSHRRDSPGYLLLLAQLGAMACSDVEQRQDLDASSGSRSPISASLPSLRFDLSANNPMTGDVNRYSTVVIGPAGQLLFTSPREEKVLTLRMRSGRFLNFGPRGDGPGEIRDPLGYRVADSFVVVLDRANQRLSRWSHDGRLMDQRSVNIPISPEFVPLNGNRWLLPGAIRDRVRVVVLDGTTGAVSEINLAADSFVAAHWGNPRLAAENPPALGTWYGGFVLGDRMSYALGFFDWHGVRIGVVDQNAGRNQPGAQAVARVAAERERTGRPLSPAATDAVARNPQPWFSRRIREDGFGRTWLIGESNDSAYADVYSGPRFLGRLVLPCLEIGPRWDLQGEWLAVICSPDDPAATMDATVKLFHINSGNK